MGKSAFCYSIVIRSQPPGTRGERHKMLNFILTMAIFMGGYAVRVAQEEIDD